MAAAPKTFVSVRPAVATSLRCHHLMNMPAIVIFKVAGAKSEQFGDN